MDSIEQNPTWVYSTAGTYTANLTVTNDAGNDSVTNSITVDPAPVAPTAQFSGNVTSGTAPLAVKFTDKSTGTAPLSYAWDFTSDGSVDSIEQNPTWVYSTAGTFTANLTVTNDAGSDSVTHIISVSEVPVASFRGTPLSGTAPLTVQFDDTSANFPSGWTWFFGDENYAVPWTRLNAHAGWSARYEHSSVVLPDGSIVLMGGYSSGSYKNDVWRSTDKGATWIQMTPSAGWSARYEHSSVVLPDGSIVLMGGGYSSGNFKNDVWRSTDRGATWIQMTPSAGWSARNGHSSVVLPDGSIVLMGGYSSSSYKNDVWRSTDKGATWIQMTPSAGWSARYEHSSVVLPDGSIVLMGGYSSGSYKNDVWRSTDKGATWIQMTPSAGWSGRIDQSSVAMPDSRIVFMGGVDSAPNTNNDLWQSIDNGATWTQITAHAGWSVRSGQSSVVLLNGDIVLMGGYGWNIEKNDVWKMTPSSSTIQNPSHIYTLPGTYHVTLQAYNAEGYSINRRRNI